MGSNNPESGNPNGALQYSRSSQESTQLVAVQNTPMAATLSLPAASSNQNAQTVSVTNTITGNSTPTGSENAAIPQPRPPRTFQGLLKFAMEATRAEDAPGNSDIGPMDEQRRQFLEEALRSLAVNVTEVLDNAIKVLTNLEKMNSIKMGDPLPDEVKNAFTVLLDHVDELDVANDFFKMGGFAMFPICYGSKNEEVRTRASSVLGTVCQNNPFCQKQALDCGLLHVLLHLVPSEQAAALTKCLYAISCMCREYEPACRELISHGGCQILVELLQSQEPAAKTKAAFLIRYFCEHYADARKQFIRQNVVKTIVLQVQAGRDNSTEHLLSILEVLVRTKDPVVLRLCRDPRYNLKKVLEDHLKHQDLRDDRFKEEKAYCADLLSIIFGSRARDLIEETVDR